MRSQGNSGLNRAQNEPSPVIAIDGAAGAGKSTLAGLLSEKLGVPYLNTGAMFRTVALKLGEDALNMDNELLKARLAELDFSLSPVDHQLLCNGEAMDPSIATEKISALASALAKNPVIRARLLQNQRKIAESGPLVADGRDMGTAVFPNARYKFFLKADPKARAMRRFLQYQSQGVEADLEELENLIKKRDEQDESRAAAPLKPAPDAIIIDTTDLALPEVLARLLQAIDPKLLTQGQKPARES